MKKPTVTFGIPAYNEEGNIKKLLKSILEQNNKSFEIERILVISDGSSDNTKNEVSKVKDKRILYFDDSSRKGKSIRLQEIFDKNNSDILVLADADTYLEKNAVEYLISPLLNSTDIGLTGGNPTPVEGSTFESTVADIGVEITKEIRKVLFKGNSIYCFNGRLLALSKELSKKIRMESTPGNDAYIFFTAKKLKYAPLYVEKAISYFELPHSLIDHDKQSLRFEQSKKNMIHYFGNKVSRFYKIPLFILVRVMVNVFLKKPIPTFIYVMHQLKLKLIHSSRLRKANNDLWDVSTSTKVQNSKSSNLLEYVVPELEKRGGIQTLAKTVFKEIHKSHDSIITNYTYLPLVLRAALLLLPELLGIQIYNNIVVPISRLKHPLKGNLIHFWFADCCGSYLHKNFIVSFHGRELLPANLKGYKRKMYKNIMDKALMIHADTVFIRDIIINDFNIEKEKIKVIYPTAGLSTKDINKHKLDNKEVVIGTLSRFNKRKNVLNIIKALQILKTDYKLKFKYTLAGTGIQKDEIIAQLKESDIDYKYLGEISEKEKNEYFYPSLDIFVLPTLNQINDVEGFGLVYLEANSFGVPVIASKVGGVGEAVKDKISGLFADPESPDDIAKKMYDLIKIKNKLKTTSIKWVEQFRPEFIASQFSTLYEQIQKK